MKVKVKVAQSCPTLCDPMHYTVHGILQARILEWVAFFFYRGSSQPMDRTQVSHIAGRFLQLSHKGSLRILEWVTYPFSRGSSQARDQTQSPTLQMDSLPAEPQGKPKNTGVGSLSLLQWIFLTQELNWGVLHCRRIFYQLSYQGSPLKSLLSLSLFSVLGFWL